MLYQIAIMGKRKITVYTSPEEREYDERRRTFLKCVREYQLSMKKFIVTSRFNTQTITENRNFIKQTKNVKCVYCCPDPIAKHIPI